MKDGRALLRDWIKRMGFNQQKAAAFLGIDHTYVSQILNGHRSPGIRNAVHIERLSGIPVEAWVPTGVDNPTSDEAVPVAKAKSGKA